MPATHQASSANRGKVPVGWVSIGPREEYRKLERSL